ncbi:MAG: serine protease, partial [Clostridiales bacterium]|nr:serine protease [Clostridiales bacterium]
TGTNDVLKHIEGKKVGDELKLGIYRDGKTKEYTVKLTDSSKIY